MSPVRTSTQFQKQPCHSLVHQIHWLMKLDTGLVQTDGTGVGKHHCMFLEMIYIYWWALHCEKICVTRNSMQGHIGEILKEEKN